MDDVTIWRYLDFSKFLDLISSKQVFFCRSDYLGDPFEGSYPEKHLERRIEEIRQNAQDFQKEAAMHVLAASDYCKYVYLNCWHTSQHESAALWRLYLKSNEGIAIQSTRDSLRASFTDVEPGVWLVPVKYIDYVQDDPPVPTRMAPFRYKRKSFEHEQELRAIVYADIQDENGSRLEPPGETGIRINADLDRLLHVVYVAPTAPDWFFDLTTRLCEQFGVEARVMRSSLETDQPVFI